MFTQKYNTVDTSPQWHRTDKTLSDFSYVSYLNQSLCIFVLLFDFPVYKDHFHWFPHMWRHEQPHKFNEEELLKNMKLNYQFALVGIFSLYCY